MSCWSRFVAIAFLTVAAPAFAQERPPSFADLVEKLSPAVVNISTTQKVQAPQAIPFGMPFQELPDTPEFEPFREFFDRFGQMQGQRGMPQEREVTSLGSGFIIDAKGYVITNNHVIDAADEVTVTLTDNAKYNATIVGRDKKTDLALLKVEAKKDLPFVPMGDSDVVRVGDWVIAIGNPFGLGGSVTQGIISARQRSINAGPFDDFLQTDAPINRGNSGGPLFNLKGEVIGINTAIFSPSGGSVGIGFAIPTALAKPIVAQLKEFGRTHRGWLGVKIQEVSEDVEDSLGLAKPTGALVLEVAKDSPADKAGIKPGDVITAFDGKEITEMRHLPRMVAEAKIGKTATLTFWRKNASHTASFLIGEQEDDTDPDTVPKPKDKDSKGKPKSDKILGMDVAPLTPAMRSNLGLGNHINGLAVVGVDQSANAARKGIRSGAVIVDVNNESVRSAEDFRKMVDSARKSGRKFVLIRIIQGREEAYVPLAVEEGK